MNVGKVIYGLLSGHNINAKIAPHGSQYYITYDVISCVTESTKDGAASIHTYRVQINIIGGNYYWAAEKAIVIKGILDFYQGTVNGVTVDLIRLENQFDRYEYDTEDYVVIQEYFIRILE